MKNFGNFNCFVNYDDNINEYEIFCLEFPEIKYFSSDLQECIEEIDILLDEYLEECRKIKKPIPKPIPRNKFPKHVSQYVHIRQKC